MAITGDPATYSDLAAVIPEVWAPIVNKEFFAKTVFANFCRDLSPYMTDGGDIVHVPGVFTNSFTPGTQTTQGAELTTEFVAMDDSTVTVNTHRYVAILIGDKDLAQIASMYDISKVYAEKIAGSLAKLLEASLAGLWSSLSTNSTGDTATLLNDAEIRAGITKLDSLDVPLDECAFFFHPYVFWNQIHAISKYYTQSSFGPSTVAGMVSTGNFPGNTSAAKALRGQLYGIPVYTSSNVVNGLLTYRNLLLHKDAFAFAVQTKGGQHVRIQSNYELRNLAALTVGDILYGVAVIRETAAVLFNASNTYIGS